MSFGTEKIPKMSKFWNDKDKNSSYDLTLPFCEDVGLLFFPSQLQAAKGTSYFFFYEEDSLHLLKV